MRDEKRRRVMMWITVALAVVLLIGVVSWMWERTYYKDQPFTFSQLILLLLIIPVGALLFAMFINPSKKQHGVTPGGQVVAPFPEAFTTVVIPWQGRPAIAVRAPSVPLDQMKGEGNDFTPAELVINVEVVDANDEHTVLSDFDPPLELEFKFPASLIKNAREIAARQQIVIKSADDFVAVIKVGFWNGTRWVLFTPEKHNFRIQGSETMGYVGKVNLKKWGDPPVAWDPPR
ncbi:MAG TPA: hypothetical protein VMP08_13130 [Anaerolineae bacterium]|nr:hypothetical protein [Anaerolineae bacterium]